MTGAQRLQDAHLIQIVDLALVDVTRRSGDHLVCRPGCAQCCVGIFAINVLDAERLGRGYSELLKDDPARSLRVKERVVSYVRRTAADYPGEPATGLLDDSVEGQERFAEFANDEVCPVLDPETSTCDLYDHRPMTCRVFGPPVRASLEEETEGFGICELCFIAASPEEIAACELVADPDHLEEDLLVGMHDGAKKTTSNTVAYALSTYFSVETSLNSNPTAS